MPFLAVSRAAALCLLSSTAAFAASPVPVSVVASSPQPAIQIVGHAARTLPAAEFAALRGEYRLSSGGSLAIEGARHRPVLVLGDRAPVALVPVGPDRLVSADGRLRLDVRTEANGLVSGLVLHLPPELL